MKASILSLTRSDLIKLGKHQDTYTIHKLVYSLFPGKKREFLYLDKGGRYGERHILLLSREAPLPPETGSIETKDVSDFFLEHRYYAFEVRLNPVVRKTGSSRMIPVKTERDLSQWFFMKQKTWGFKADPDRLTIEEMGLQMFKKGDKSIYHNQATFKGILEVMDRKLFLQSFNAGMGRGKAFGFGLLQVKPIMK